MSVFIAGIGAVSPAGWSVAAALSAVRNGAIIQPQLMERSGWEAPLRLRTVPPPASRPSFMSHARLRRASPLSQYAAGASLEAIAPRAEAVRAGRLGLVSCVQSGPVQYACRFYEELLKDPATASPLLFPETVFSAPASHIAALLENTPCATTLLGDPGAFLQGLAFAAGWLEEGRADFCLVLGAEEFNWVHADATWHLDTFSTLGAGAGAVLLTANPAHSIGVELELVTDPHTYSSNVTSVKAAARMRQQLPANNPDELLCDSRGGARKLDRAEALAWEDWAGARMSPKTVLGEGLMAGAAWQVALAVEELRSGHYQAANVSIVGVNQQAIGARLRARESAGAPASASA